MATYPFIIAISIITVLSFLFNVLANKTNFPSVLLLIFLGVGVKVVMQKFNLDIDFFPVLESLGVIGLIMIVLEAALDLKLERDKRGMIGRSMLIAFVSLILTSLIIAFIFDLLVPYIDFYIAFLYAIPLAIMSSAIIIPSVVNLSEYKKEFMIYESTFSDIFGIMLFFYVEAGLNWHGVGEVVSHISINLITTVVVSLLIGYVLVWALQALKSRTKFFLIMSVLILLYAIGKLMHISSLLIILIFGLVLNNREIFFRGRMEKMISNRGIFRLLEDFKLFTAETSFLIRTFFFVFFGMTLTFEAFLGLNVWLMSLSVLLSIFIVRFGMFKFIQKQNISPEVFIAPRGLISILLYYSIPEELKVEDFETGILFVVIIITSLIMAVSLMKHKNKPGDVDTVSNIDEGV